VRRVLIPLLCLSISAACGGDELSKADLIKKGDAICRDSNKRLEPVFGKVFKPGEGNPPADKAAPILKEAAKLVRRQYERFAALEPGDKEKKDFKRFVETFKTTVTLLDESVVAAEKGDSEGYLKKLQLANEADSSTSGDMKAFGFKSCAGVAEA
jgi:hypothetical protein